MMDRKRKISILKVLQVFAGVVLTACCITALLSAEKVERQMHLQGVAVNITNNNYRFLNNDQVLDLVINDRHINIKQTTLAKADIYSMETILRANPWVAGAEAYIDNTHILHLNVTQRVPVARIFENDGSSYYLDSSLSAMPVSGRYTFYTTVVTNVPELRDDSLGKSIKGSIVALVRFIEKDTFWNAQVSQIMMDSTYAFELVPVLGSHTILLGDTADMKAKFDNLFVFYKKIMGHIGWEKYTRLDLRYKNQVVASPSLPWKGPVDKGMKTMNWYEKMMDSVKNKNDDGTAAVPVIVKKDSVKVKPASAKLTLTASGVKLPARKPAPAAKMAANKDREIRGKYIYKNNNAN